MPAAHILITGGTGFLGSAIVHAFLEHHPEHRYTVLDIAPVASWTCPRPDISYLEVDVCDAAAVQAAISSADPTVVVHSAGVVPAGAARYNQSQRAHAFAVNVHGTRNVLDAARHPSSSVKAFVYTSSATVVGDDAEHDHPNVSDDVETGWAKWVYGESKTAAENLVLAANSSSFPTTILRPSVLFGPGDVQLVPAIHALIAAHSTPITLGSGTNLYDFTYVSNAADAHVFAVRSLLAPLAPAAGHPFFISNAEPVPFRDFCRAVWAQFGHVPYWEVRVPVTLAKGLGWVADGVAGVLGAEWSLSAGAVGDAVGTMYVEGKAARDVLGYVPRVGLTEGVRRACEDYKRVLADRERERQ